VFDGWYTTTESSGGVHVNKDTDIAAHGLMLFARWKVPVTFINNVGQHMNVKTEYKVIGDFYGSLDYPYAQGYNFLGWYPGQNGNGAQLQETHTVTENVTVYYAKWGYYTATVANYFDIGYGVLNGNEYLEPEDEEQSRWFISNYINNVANRYKDPGMIGVHLTYPTPALLMSSADLCKNSSVTNQNLNELCEHNTLCYDCHLVGEYCGSMVCPNPNNEAIVCTYIQHMAEHFHESIPAPANNRIMRVLWSGNRTESVSESGETEKNRSYSWSSMGHVPPLVTMMLTADVVEKKLNRYTYSSGVLMHELNHFLGAHDHYHEVEIKGDDESCINKYFCSKCNKNNYYQTTCIMYNSRQSINNNPHNIICLPCKDDMINYLDNYFY